MDKKSTSKVANTLALLAVLVIGILMIPGVFPFVIILLSSLFTKPNTDDKVPLLNAMITETREIWKNNRSVTWTASKAVLKFIPIGTTKAKALSVLKQNKFDYQVTPTEKDTEQISAHLWSGGYVCSRSYIIYLTLKNDLIQDVNALEEDHCL